MQLSSSRHDQVYAAIDLGSNSFHLLLVEVFDGQMRIRSRVKQKVRLASGLDASQTLSQEAMQRGWDCLAVFAQQLQHIPKQNISVVATATLRIARNRASFLAKGNEILGHEINVISGEQEAKYIFNGVTSGKKHNLTSLVIDIGGASTEVAYGRGTQAEILHSVNMGCVTFTNRFFGQQQLNEKNFKQAVEAAKQALQPILADFAEHEANDCLGASGTPQAIIEILQARQLPAVITPGFLQLLAQECCSSFHMDNLKITGLKEARRAIFPAGLAILIALFECLQIDKMHLAQGALREGVLAELLPTNINRDRDKVLSLFKIDIDHAHRIYRCCQQLLANCQPELDVSPPLQKVLENVCMLHEAGQSISFKDHQKHSRYLILNTNMAWLNFEEKQLIANIVSSNPSSGTLDVNAEQQLQVGVLIRILRIATILCSQRDDDRFATPDIVIEENVWRLSFRQGYLKNNPLLHHLLNEEAQAITRVNWQLSLSDA